MRNASRSRAGEQGVIREGYLTYAVEGAYQCSDLFATRAEVMSDGPGMSPGGVLDGAVVRPHGCPTPAHRRRSHGGGGGVIGHPLAHMGLNSSKGSALLLRRTPTSRSPAQPARTLLRSTPTCWPIPQRGRRPGSKPTPARWGRFWRLQVSLGDSLH